ncbi:hypothetical protein [Gephyromycinifex aptenodytis]|uniref:hypothetical protein n=1 Tax=Gephyromycinifex aptenodytis TaxID=2716227 RepID=UPI00144880AC|nr:hypothetical protein [Gephyromycinifex aptenodytis]
MESQTPYPESYDPTHALADAAAARESIAQRLYTPWWYHPILGLNAGALVLIVAFAAEGLLLAALGLASIGVSLALIRAYRRITGLWVELKQCGPGSRRLWGIYMVAVFAAAIPAFCVRFDLLPSWCAWGAAVLIAIASFIIGPRFDGLLRDEIRDGSAPIGLS